MLSLPSLAPQDSYTLWYTSSTSNNLSPYAETAPDNDHLTSPNRNQNNASTPNRRQNSLYRSPLARLKHEEEYIERRKQNIQNYGSSWIKPPGIAKSLYQIREEQREMAEHQEALRREALQQELADAEAEGAEELLQGEGMDGDAEEARDLDDDVPDADAETTGFGGEESDNEDEENEIEEIPRPRMPDSIYREALVRGNEVRDTRFGEEGGSTIDEEEQSQMLQEEDLIHENGAHRDLDMDMDADLDADIPDADEGGYEHTDTEAEFTSSDDESVDQGRLPPRQLVTTSMVRSDGTQNSMDLGSMGSSQMMDSSPRDLMGHRANRGRGSSG